MKVCLIIAWVIWTFLFVAWPTDLLVAFLRESGEPSEPEAAFVGALGFVGFVTLSLTFALKWFLLRFLIHPSRISPGSAWGAVVFIVGCLIIWGLTKSVEIFGLILFFGSESMTHYLAFWVPSLIVMLIHMPFLLDPRRVYSNRAEKEAAFDG